MNLSAALAAVDATPRNPGAWVTLGDAFARTGNVTRARKAYNEALSLDATHEQAWAGLDRLDAIHDATTQGDLLVSQGDFGAARQQYLTALALDPWLDLAHSALNALDAEWVIHALFDNPKLSEDQRIEALINLSAKSRIEIFRRVFDLTIAQRTKRP